MRKDPDPALHKLIISWHIEVRPNIILHVRNTSVLQHPGAKRLQSVHGSSVDQSAVTGEAKYMWTMNSEVHKASLENLSELLTSNSMRNHIEPDQPLLYLPIIIKEPNDDGICFTKSGASIENDRQLSRNIFPLFCPWLFEFCFNEAQLFLQNHWDELQKI